MSPDQFIETAERLLASADQESDKRSAVSRAYYGAFHECVINLPDVHAPTASAVRSAESHKAVVDALAAWGKSFDLGRTDAQQAGRKLMLLKSARRRADYEIANPLNLDDVGSCIADSKKIVKLIRDARARFDKRDPQDAGPAQAEAAN